MGVYMLVFMRLLACIRVGLYRYVMLQPACLLGLHNAINCTYPPPVYFRQRRGGAAGSLCYVPSAASAPRWPARGPRSDDQGAGAPLTYPALLKRVRGRF